MQWLDMLLGVNKTNKKIEEIRQDTSDKITEAATSMKKAQTLQTKILQKTTTYYIGRAMGNIVK